ncbi:hypothetical protein [Kosakonia pseudosacchari]|uniref:hypothetical protein n=1 Tax=Kosakonia pseudosacchari TaxID=1646340 RepID=UPI000A37AB73|nr:hypothetical protein [Kosakonia pseudosacchari]
MKIISFVLIAFVANYSYASECQSGEILIASCDIPGKINSVAAFCAKKEDDTIRYTFSKGNVSELTVDFDSQNKLKRWIDLGTYTTYLGFNRGVYSYVLRVPEEKPGVVAYLDVKKNGGVISSRRCDSNSFGEKNIKMNSIEDVDDAFVRNNRFNFP